MISFLANSLLQIYHALNPDASEGQKLNQVIQATNLKNSLDQYPTIQAQKEILSGHQYTFNLPPGISLKEFVDRKPYFETHTNGTIDIYPPTNRRLILQVHHIEFPDIIPFSFDPPENLLAPIHLGRGMDGNDLITDLAELPHLLVGGLPGFGKTSLLRTLTVALKLAGTHVLAIDRKRIDFPPLAKYLNVAQTEDEAYSLVQMLLKENERRQSLLAFYGATKIQELPPNILDYLVLIVDECGVIETKATQEGLDELAHLARATGISLIMATQKPSAKLWDGRFSNTRDMMAGRVSYYVGDYITSQMILGKGNTGAARLPLKKGRAIAVLGEKEQTIQTMFLELAEAKTLLDSIQAAPYFESIETHELKKKKVGRPKKKKEE